MRRRRSTRKRLSASLLIIVTFHDEEEKDSRGFILSEGDFEAWLENPFSGVLKKRGYPFFQSRAKRVSLREK